VFWPAPCIASANSPLPLINEGLVNWTRVLNVPPSKLILGLPWYGYRYKCIDNPTPGEVRPAIFSCRMGTRWVQLAGLRRGGGGEAALPSS
jgi:hypothetical protein